MKFAIKHRLPVFTGIRLCITGLHDLETRERIAVLLKEHGGVCVKSFDSSCTHLLCSESASEKIARAKQTNRDKGRKKIHVIWEEWFWDCLEFNGKRVLNISRHVAQNQTRKMGWRTLRRRYATTCQEVKSGAYVFSYICSEFAPDFYQLRRHWTNRSRYCRQQPFLVKIRYQSLFLHHSLWMM